MNVDLELYRIFYVVANAGNITKASQELCISQPAVTKQIKLLEAQLGGDLFVRTKRGVVLTENGKEIYNYIKQGMNYFEAAEMQFSNLKRLECGTIRIGVSTTLTRIFLLEYLERFHKLYPNIAIQIFTDPGKLLRQKIKDGSLDILIAKENTLEDEDLEVTRLGKLHHIFIASSKYKELKGKEISLEKLNDYPILLPKTPSTTRDTLDRFCRDNNIELTSKLEIASSTLLEDFVQIGLGVGLVTKEFAQKEIDAGNIFEVITKPALPPSNFAIITLKNSFHSFGTNKLIEMISEYIEKKN